MLLFVGEKTNKFCFSLQRFLIHSEIFAGKCEIIRWRRKNIFSRVLDQMEIEEIEIDMLRQISGNTNTMRHIK